MKRTSLQAVVENELVEDELSVWRLRDHTDFGYSDGAESERYLRNVFSKAADLSAGSAELESYIKDWPSEYHLSRKRAQLLSGFSFDRSFRVLEVGCGCGAITRHLGESFNQVVSVEGNINRARLARQRTRDLDSVSIICAPFQEIRFSEKFDILFCIGVFEYSASFIAGEDPYDAALQYFSSILAPGGLVVIAIENQFGLKYFCSAREDHLGVMFEGLEGYHRNLEKVRTFGKVELEARLKNYFPHVEFYYPYPDYKLPECVLSAEFMASGRAGELISQLRSKDYSGPTRPLWDESATVLELARNGMLEFFSNSFIAIAGSSPLKGAKFDQLAVLFSSRRQPRFSTRTRITENLSGELVATKRSIQGEGAIRQGPLTLIDTDAGWIDGLSLQTYVMLRARAPSRSIADIFAPCRAWVEFLISESNVHDGILYIDGAHVDSIWSNAYVVDGECRIVDREWVWAEKIRTNALVIRAIYDFLSKTDTHRATPGALTARSGKRMIREIAAAIGVHLNNKDFGEFIRLESQLQWIVFGVSTRQQWVYLTWYFANRSSLKMFRRVLGLVRAFFSRVRRRIGY